MDKILGKEPLRATIQKATERVDHAPGLASFIEPPLGR